MATITPKNYKTVQANETLNALVKKELKGKTTLSVLEGLNTKFKGKKIPKGTGIKYLSSSEYNKYRLQKAQESKKKADAAYKKAVEKIRNSFPPNGNKFYLMKLKFHGLEIQQGQWGVVQLTDTVTWYSKNKSKKLVAGGTLKKGTKHRVMGLSKAYSAYILAGNKYVKYNAKLTYYSIPDKMHELNEKDTSGGPKLTWDDIKTERYRRPAYRRPMIRYKGKDGKYSNVVELRLNSFTENLSTALVPVRTNGGWYINVSGPDLSTISVSGYLLDTKAVAEFSSFMSVYHAHIKAKNAGSYVKVPTIKFNHKNREYVVVVRALTINETSEQIFYVMYSMEFLVLSEKALSGTNIKDLPSRTNKDLSTNPYYYTNVKAQFTNTVTGKFGGF